MIWKEAINMTWKDEIIKQDRKIGDATFTNREFNIRGLITVAINEGLSNPKEILRIANFKRKEGDYLFTEEDLDEVIEIIKKEMDAYLYKR